MNGVDELHLFVDERKFKHFEACIPLLEIFRNETNFMCKEEYTRYQPCRLYFLFFPFLLLRL